MIPAPRLQALLGAARTGRPPRAWEQARTGVAANYRAMSDYLAAHPGEPLYGHDTLPGHRDGERLEAGALAAFQEQLIQRHTLSAEAPYDDFTARCIGCVKVEQIAAPGPIFSPGTYDQLRAAVLDPDFRPRVPRGSSYSCGDVIPAAHWSADLLQHIRRRQPGFALQPGEGMALINGSFVHLGATAAACAGLARLWPLLLDSLRSDLRLAACDARIFQQWLGRDAAGPAAAVLRELAGHARTGTSAARQQPVSFRGIPQVLEGFAAATAALTRELETALARPSGNPLMLPESDAGGARIPCSQGSFLAPGVAIMTSALLESLLLTAWSTVSRSKWLLSGAVEGIPRDGSRGPGDMGYIQWPKLLQAQLEALRLRCGRLLYAAGGDTSYGVEDLWTQGVDNTARLSDAIDRLRHLLGIGLLLKARLAADHGLDAGLDPAVTALALGAETVAAGLPEILARYDGQAATGPLPLFTG